MQRKDRTEPEDLEDAQPIRAVKHEKACSDESAEARPRRRQRGEDPRALWAVSADGGSMDVLTAVKTLPV